LLTHIWELAGLTVGSEHNRAKNTPGCHARVDRGSPVKVRKDVVAPARCLSASRRLGSGHGALGSTTDKVSVLVQDSADEVRGERSPLPRRQTRGELNCVNEVAERATRKVDSHHVSLSQRGEWASHGRLRVDMTNHDACNQQQHNNNKTKKTKKKKKGTVRESCSTRERACRHLHHVVRKRVSVDVIVCRDGTCQLRTTDRLHGGRVTAQ
jgi:hypothetical protein